MKCGALTVGTDAVVVPISGSLSEGLRLLGRSANSGNVYMGFDSTVTTSTGFLIPKGDSATSFPAVVPASHYGGGGSIYLIADAAAQIVDWEGA